MTGNYGIRIVRQKLFGSAQEKKSNELIVSDAADRQTACLVLIIKKGPSINSEFKITAIRAIKIAATPEEAGIATTTKIICAK